jgi:outer membrane protein assembly factor BamB
MRTYPAFLTWLALVAAGAAATPGTDTPVGEWVRFRGPNGAGVSTETGLPAVLSEAENLVWKTPMPPGHSSPVVSHGRIFLTAYEGETLLVICLRASDGTQIWRRESPRARKEKLDERNSPASPSPAVSSDAVFVFFPDFGLLSYTFEGKERWRTPLGPFQNVYGMGSSPIIADDAVVLVCDQSLGSFIVSFDAASGRERWRTPRPEALSGHSTPVLYRTPAGETQIVAPASFRMDVYSPKTGEALWWVQGLPSEMKSTPIVTQIDGEDRIFVSGYNTPENDPGRQVAIPPFEEVLAKSDRNHDGKISKDEADPKAQMYFPFLDLDADGVLDQEEWKKYQLTMAAENGILAVRPGGRGDLSEKGLVWKYQRAVPQLPSPVLAVGVIFMLNDSGVLTTLDAASGKMLKQGRLRGVSDRYFASPVAGDGKVYIASKSGTVTIVQAGPEADVLSTASLDGEIYATPAIAGGRVFIRTTTTLYCFGGKGQGTGGSGAPR